MHGWNARTKQAVEGSRWARPRRSADGIADERRPRAPPARCQYLRSGPGQAPAARDRRGGPARPLRSRQIQHRCLDLSGRAAGRGRAEDRCRRAGGARDRARVRRAGDRSRRRHLPGRPDGRRWPGHRLLQVSGRSDRARLRGAHRLGRARRRARPPEPVPQAARAVLPGRHLDQQPRDARRHGGEQRVRRPLDPLRHHGRQSARDRCAARRRRGDQVRRGAGQPGGGRHPFALPRADPERARHCRPGGGRDRHRVPEGPAPGRGLQSRSRAPVRAQHGAAPGRFRGHARPVPPAPAAVAAAAAAPGPGRLPFPDFSRRHGFDQGDRRARAFGGRAGRSHDPRAGPPDPGLPAPDRALRARRPGCPAAGRVRRRRGGRAAHCSCSACAS